MLKSVFTAVAALLVLPSLIGGAVFPAAAASSLPLLSGAYTYTVGKFCQLPVTVLYRGSPNVAGSPFVQEVITTGAPVSQPAGAGTMKFVQSATAKGSGTIMLNGTSFEGTTILLTSTGAGTSGVDGTPLAAQATTGSSAFTQTATSIAITATGSTFNIYYGKVLTGIVQYAVFVGIDSKGCADQYTITHN